MSRKKYITYSDTNVHKENMHNYFYFNNFVIFVL